MTSVRNALRWGIIAVILAAPNGTMAWTAGNSQTVTPLTDRSFEVLGQAGSANVDYWCAAGDFARRVLRVPNAQRLYVSRGRARAATANRKSAVQFSLDPPPDGDTAWHLLLSVTRVGENLTAGAAWRYCLRHRAHS